MSQLAQLVYCQPFGPKDWIDIDHKELDGDRLYIVLSGDVNKVDEVQELVVGRTTAGERNPVVQAPLSIEAKRGLESIVDEYGTNTVKLQSDAFSEVAYIEGPAFFEAVAEHWEMGYVHMQQSCIRLRLEDTPGLKDTNMEVLMQRVKNSDLSIDARNGGASPGRASNKFKIFCGDCGAHGNAKKFCGDCGNSLISFDSQLKDRNVIVET